MINSFLVIGIKALTGGKKAFVNFTENLLKKDVVTLFPKEYLVVEILENIEPTIEVIEACKKAKEDGIQMALDDFVVDEKFNSYMDYTDIIKVDFMNTDEIDQQRIVKKYKKFNIKFLAEKIESYDEFEKALNYGYDYFQGYFFSKPIIIKSRNIPHNKINALQLIKMINETEPSISNISRIIEKDVSLSYDLLKLINSAAFYRSQKINSINQAVVFLGLEELKKWAYLIVLRRIGEDKPSEIIKYSLSRAKFCELMAKKLEFEDKAPLYFLMGLFSNIDVLMGRPIDELLESLPLSDEIYQTLLGKESKMRMVYDVAIAFEKGEWLRIWGLVVNLNIKEEEIAKNMYKAIEWANSMIEYAKA